jgi:UvrD-like helicase family protein
VAVVKALRVRLVAAPGVVDQRKAGKVIRRAAPDGLKPLTGKARTGAPRNRDLLSGNDRSPAEVNVTQHYPMLQRNLLYTGVTRGKRLVVLLGQKKAVAIAVRNVSGRRRWSKLREWLMTKGQDNSSTRLVIRFAQSSSPTY